MSPPSEGSCGKVRFLFRHQEGKPLRTWKRNECLSEVGRKAPGGYFRNWQTHIHQVSLQNPCCSCHRENPSIYIYIFMFCFFMSCVVGIGIWGVGAQIKSISKYSSIVLYSTSFSKRVNLLQKDTTQNQHKYIYFFFSRLFFILVWTDVPHCILIVTSSSPLVHVNFQLITSCCASMVNLFFLLYWSNAPRRNLQKPQTTIKIHIVPHISENQQTGTMKSNYWLWITWSTMSSLLQPKKAMLLH